jgi:hypothetical protein
METYQEPTKRVTSADGFSHLRTVLPSYYNGFILGMCLLTKPNHEITFVKVGYFKLFSKNPNTRLRLGVHSRAHKAILGNIF